MDTEEVYDAAKRGDLEAVKYHLEREKFADDVKREIAGIAAENNDLKLLRYISDKDPSIVRKQKDRNYSVFRRAVGSGSLDVVKYLVEEHDANILHKDLTDWSHSYTPTVVHLAIQNGHYNILKYFLEDEKLDVNVPLDGSDATVLLLAKRHNAGSDILKYIIEDKNANLTMVNSNGEHILYEAANQKDLDFIKYVLDERKAEIDINWRNKRGQTLLKQAVCSYVNCGVDLIEYLVGQKHADVNTVDDHKEVPLHCVQSAEVCTYLIKSGANINQKGKVFDDTPLHSAIDFCDSEEKFKVIKCLIKEGADINASNKNGATPLNTATTSESEFQYQICKLLIKSGADINQGNQFGNTPLHFTIVGKQMFGRLFAGDQPNEKLCRYFIECGANVTQGNNMGDTPLHLAVRYNRLRLYRELIDGGADVNQPNKEGETPVYIAVDGNHFEILKFLVGEKHADINIARHSDRMTPLHSAATRNRYDLCEYLVKNGANILVEDQGGKTPIDCASNKRIIEYLRKMATEIRSRRSAVYSTLRFLPFSAPVLHTDKMNRITADVFLRVHGRPSTFVSDVAYVSPIQGFLALAGAFISPARISNRPYGCTNANCEVDSFDEEVVRRLAI